MRHEGAEVDSALLDQWDRAGIHLLHSPRHLQGQALSPSGGSRQGHAGLGRNADQDDGRTRTGGIDGLGDAVIATGRLDDDVHPSSLRGLVYQGKHLLIGGVEDDISTEVGGSVTTVSERLNRDDLRSSRRASELHRAQPDRATTDDSDGLPDFEVSKIQGVNRHTERFQHCRIGVAEGVRDRVEQLGGPGEKLPQATVGMAMTSKPDQPAQIALAIQAFLAAPARLSRIHRYAPAVLRTTRDDSPDLVAQDQRSSQPGIADPCARKPVEVRSAEPHGDHPHHAVPGAGLRSRLIAQPDIPNAVETRGLHVVASIMGTSLHLGSPIMRTAPIRVRAQVTMDAVATFELLTFGHGRASREQILEILHDKDVRRLVDVRTAPASRAHPHVSRAALEKWLPEAGIAYRWEPRLGGFRTAARDSPDIFWENAFRGYAGHLRTPQAREAVRDLLNEASAERTTVMCSESLWWRCHRRLIADDAVLVTGVSVPHLMHDGGLEPHRPSPGARVQDGVLVYDQTPSTVDGFLAHATRRRMAPLRTKGP